MQPFIILYFTAELSYQLYLPEIYSSFCDYYHIMLVMLFPNATGTWADRLHQIVRNECVEMRGALFEEEEDEKKSNAFMTHHSFQAQRAHFHNHYVEEEVKKAMESYAAPTCVRINVHNFYPHDWA